MASWLGTWENRRKITIDNADVDAILSDFPVLIKISASSGTSYANLTDIFTELTADANRKKIAITTSDGTTQCYVEIERWDHANSAAWLWVKVPSVAAASATELYLYYDVSQADNTTYVGDTTDAVTHNVWDANFVGVWHMAQDPNGDGADAIKDSTSNQNDGTPEGSMTSADLVDGQIGKAIDFDGSNDGIEIGDIDLPNSFTIESALKNNDQSIYRYPISKRGTANNYYFQTTLSGTIKFGIYDGAVVSAAESTTDVVDNTWRDCAGVRDIVADTVAVFVDGISENSITDLTTTAIVNNANAYIGLRNDDKPNNQWIGQIDEVRFSDIARSAAWLKATYYSNRDGLVAFGAAELLTLFPNNVECSTEVTSPSLLFVPGTLDDVSCGTQVTAPSLEVASLDINASDVSCLTQVTAPSLDKVKSIDPSHVESSSEITTVSTAFPCAIAATLPMLTADFLGGGGGVIDATLPMMSADIFGGGTIIAATLPVMSASITGKVGIAGEIETTLPVMTALITGTTNVLAEIDATLPAMTALVVGVVGDSAALAATLPMITAELDGYHDITGDIEAELPAMTAFIVGTPDRFADCDVLRFEEPEL